MRALERHRLRRALPLLAATLAPATSLLAAAAFAATLHAGDVVVLGRFPANASAPQAILVFGPVAGEVQTIEPRPALRSVQDLAIPASGRLLLSDTVQGLVSLDPTDGSWSVLQPPAAFGGDAPTAIALAPNGDLLAAGAFGVARLAGGTGAPQSVSTASFDSDARGLATDGGSDIWVSDSGILHVDAATGTATRLTLCCSGFLFPYGGVASLQRGPDGALYAVNAPGGGGPSARANGGIFRVDPATGESSMWRQQAYLQAFAFDAAGGAWLSIADNISLTPYGGRIEGGPWSTSLGNRGPVAIVPQGIVTEARKSTWGAIKRLYEH